jgi:hypothetical protein
MQYSLPPNDPQKNWNSAPHCVILGAGASLSTCPNGDANGLRLPTMNNLIEVLNLRETLTLYGVETVNNNFETIYSDLVDKDRTSPLIKIIEERTREYFSSLVLPESVTLYDKIICSLRKKDIIATFNWDPLLVQAYERCRAEVGNNLPRMLFLHGNVAIGFCETHRHYGNIDARCSSCGNDLTPSPLLFPIKEKHYSDHTFLKTQWEMFRKQLRYSYLTTIFGYSSPLSDIEARSIFESTFSENPYRLQCQIEAIDIIPASELWQKWDGIIYKNYFEVYSTINKSWLFSFPRRSCEAFAAAYLQCDPWRSRKLPRFSQLQSLFQYVAPYIKEEARFESHGGAIERW